MEASKQGILEKYNVELIGATEEIIDKAEDRDKFKAAMEKIGCNVPESSRPIQSKNRLKLPKKLGSLCHSTCVYLGWYRR